LKITAFNGSPRAGKGNTHVMVEAFLAGAREAGAEVENVFLADKTIKHCTGCFKCWSTTPGKCAISDDMNGLLEKYLASDVVVFATPLYIDNVSGMMKCFMDRLVPVGDPHLEFDGNGETRHVRRYEKYPDFVVISNCGFPEQSQFQVLRLLFRRIARNMHAKVLAEIYKSAGAVLGRPPEPLKEAVGYFLKLLSKAGRQIAEGSEVSKAILSQIEKPFVDAGAYVDKANRIWDEILDKNPK
jgi:multimeric flavodoxin WrbA